MKPMKRIPLKIFIIVLFAGIVGILGTIVLKYDIDRISENYSGLVKESFVNKEYINDISNLLYQHQSITAEFVIAHSESESAEYFEEETLIRNEITKKLSEFGERMSGDRREQLFHKVYSNTYSYLSNSDVVTELIRQDSSSTANFYVSTTMSNFIEDINLSLDDLQELTDEEMNRAYDKMDYYIYWSRISEIVCIVCISIAVVMALSFCVRITSNLEKYKNSLEIEIGAKSRELIEHNEKIISIQANTLIGMANLIESHDGDTGEHIKRTSAYVGLLAKTARERGYCADILTDEYIEQLVKAAPMHDIGKIAISDTILKKPGRLTPEEFEIMKTHATQGGRIVRDVLENIEERAYVDIAYEVASAHHERWDGSGYPLGLARDKIPVCARIMAIADVFDALVSERCYKKAMTRDEAFRIIEESSGNHFDPVLAGMFIEKRAEVEKILDSKD